MCACVNRTREDSVTCHDGAVLRNTRSVVVDDVGLKAYFKSVDKETITVVVFHTTWCSFSARYGRVRSMWVMHIQGTVSCWFSVSHASFGIVRLLWYHTQRIVSHNTHCMSCQIPVITPATWVFLTQDSESPPHHNSACCACTAFNKIRMNVISGWFPECCCCRRISPHFVCALLMPIATTSSMHISGSQVVPCDCQCLRFDMLCRGRHVLLLLCTSVRACLRAVLLLNCCHRFIFLCVLPKSVDRTEPMCTLCKALMLCHPELGDRHVKTRSFCQHFCSVLFAWQTLLKVHITLWESPNLLIPKAKFLSHVSIWNCERVEVSTSDFEISVSRNIFKCFIRCTCMWMIGLYQKYTRHNENQLA